jgi:hypothetical protein
LESREPTPLRIHGSYDFSGQDVFIVREGDEFFEGIQRGPEESNRASSDLQMVLDTWGNVRCALNTILTGNYARKAILELEGKTQLELEAYLESAGSAIDSGATLIASSISDLSDMRGPVRSSLEFEIDGFARVEGEVMRVVIPSNPLDFDHIADYLTLEERSQPMMIWTERSVVQETRVRIPESYEVDQMPPDTVIASDVVRCEIDCSLSEGTLICTKTFSIRSKFIRVDEYEGFKRAYEVFSGERASEILLKKI